MHPDFNDKLLSSDPALFFGLENGWTETDLKRAYAKAIRQWKPEKFPEEFQRIVKAREMLKKYGAPAEPGPVFTPISPDAENNPVAIQEAFALPSDPRVASRIWSEESREEALNLLSARGLDAPADAMALARLRAKDGEDFDIATLAAAMRIERPGENPDAPLIALVETILANFDQSLPENALEALEPFVATSFYFDITANRWIALSRKNPTACLMRVDRLIHFTEQARNLRHVLFLLRFGISGAMRLPLDWLKQQARHLRHLSLQDNLLTPAGGRLASHGPFGTRSREVSVELEFFESLLAMREDLESLRPHPHAERHLALLSAFCEMDAERCVDEWITLSGRILDPFTPWTDNPGATLTVMRRIRESLDSAVIEPAARLRPAAISGLQHFFSLCLRRFALLVCTIWALSLFVPLFGFIATTGWSGKFWPILVFAILVALLPGYLLCPKLRTFIVWGFFTPYVFYSNKLSPLTSATTCGGITFEPSRMKKMTALLNYHLMVFAGTRRKSLRELYFDPPPPTAPPPGPLRPQSAG